MIWNVFLGLGISFLIIVGLFFVIDLVKDIFGWNNKDVEDDDYDTYEDEDL